jgi:hypothetical protein
MDEEGIDDGFLRIVHVPESDACEEIEGLVVGVVVGGVRDEDPGGAEAAEERLEVEEDLVALVGGACAEGV